MNCYTQTLKPSENLLLCPQEEKARAERATERVRAIKAWRGEAAERASGARDLRVARNRGVVRAHERLLREASRARDDDRTRRMEALKVGGRWRLARLEV